jgi:hypothetical protein
MTKMNIAPKHILDAEFGFSRKLGPAPTAVLTDLRKRSREIKRGKAASNTGLKRLIAS